jgi:D-arabinan exo alpha-(1,3)/(1,5)-arabinofuranosidase (non-reducing end)
MTPPDGFEGMMELPRRWRSRRRTHRIWLKPGETFTLFSAEGPACIRHFWLTYNANEPTDQPLGRQLTLRIRTELTTQPDVEMPLDAFFGVLFGNPPYCYQSRYLNVLPQNGLNCYLPIPFAESCTFELTNNSDVEANVWFMADWQQYAAGTELPPHRLRARFASGKPAPAYGSFLMDEIEGDGWIAGFFMGVRPVQTNDCWYHTGGDLWLIDGETHPHVIHGIGSEDVFGFSFGVHTDCADWTGTPLKLTEPPGPDPTGVRETVSYRFFGPDPIRFENSIQCRFGSRANDVESVVYSYVAANGNEQSRVEPMTWNVVGPFPCRSVEQFQRAEFPEVPRNVWPREVVADFDQYAAPHGPLTFPIWRVETQRTWLDFTSCFRTPSGGNTGTQPVDVSAYAAAQITCPSACRKRLSLGFDDGLRLWINGRLVLEQHHDRGMATFVTPPLDLHEGANNVLLKLSNTDNEEWRVWALSVRLLDDGGDG